MSMDMVFDMMNTYAPSIAATKKSLGVPEGFVWYEFEWLGEGAGSVMKVTGGQTRLAKTGKNKGKPILPDGCYKKTVYITPEDILVVEAAIEDNR
jgi:hypothetical protein